MKHAYTMTQAILTRLQMRNKDDCRICGRPINVGDEVHVSRNRCGFNYRHETCYDKSMIK